MGTEILKSFGALQNELEQAKNSLKGVDEHIKRLIGRDPSDLPPRLPQGVKRGPVNQNDERNRLGSRGNRSRPESNEPPPKRRSGVSVFQRLSDRPVHDSESHKNQRQIISKVIVTPKEVPSRQEALAAQSKDEQSKARNRRMFGALLGTLQKFQQEETKLKTREEKRAQLEKKIEEHEIKEKEEIKRERQELFFNRKKKQAEIKMIELKMLRMKEYAAWEERQKPRMNFILTKTKPQIQYLPRRLNNANKALLETCKIDIEQLIAKRRQQVNDDLQQIEERMKRNFEPKKSKDEQVIEEEVDNEHEQDHDLLGDDDVSMPEMPSTENANENLVDENLSTVEEPSKVASNGITETNSNEVENSSPEEIVINKSPNEENSIEKMDSEDNVNQPEEKCEESTNIDSGLAD